MSKLEWLQYDNWTRIAKTLRPGKLTLLPNPPDYNTHRVDTVPTLGEAEVVTSQVIDKNGIRTGTHKLILDIDMPAVLVPSTTEGHYHLYIDHEMDWDTYVLLLDALSQAGIIQEGYFAASEDRGFTCLRTPWTKKTEPGDS